MAGGRGGEVSDPVVSDSLAEPCMIVASTDISNDGVDEMLVDMAFEKLMSEATMVNMAFDLLTAKGGADDSGATFTEFNCPQAVFG